MRRHDQRAKQQHALGLAVTGLALPHGNRRGEIERLLALPRPVIEKPRLLAAAARAGEVIPAGSLTEGLGDLLNAAQAQPWRLDENRGELMGWIELFPFSDDPERVHEALALVPQGHRRPHALRRLLEALPYGPLDSALRIAAKVGRGPAGILAGIWVDERADAAGHGGRGIRASRSSGRGEDRGRQRIPAVTGFDGVGGDLSPGARGDDRAASSAPPRGSRPSGWRWPWATRRTRRCSGALRGACGRARRHYAVSRVLRNLAVGKRPSEKLGRRHEEFGVPLTALRSRLFGMLPPGDARARLAKECLIAIDEYRDERGRAGDEPRHPDIASGRPWPPEAGEPNTAVGAYGRYPARWRLDLRSPRSKPADLGRNKVRRDVRCQLGGDHDDEHRPSGRRDYDFVDELLPGAREVPTRWTKRRSPPRTNRRFGVVTRDEYGLLPRVPRPPPP